MTTTKTAHTVRSCCTPAQHAQANKSKPVSLLALVNDGPHGKAALLEFPSGGQRMIDLVTQFDGWHPLFADLSPDDRQRLRDHATPAFTNHPDGTRSRPDPLSFTRRVQDARGSLLRFAWFDVPAQDYAEGTATGYRCAAELLEALALGHGPHIQMGRILTQAGEALQECFHGASRRGAAAAFLEVVDSALVFFAKHANHQPWLADKIDRAEQYAQDAAERRAMERTEFVQRMKAGKTAKRKAREAATSGSAA